MNNEMVLCKCGFRTECPTKKQNVEKIYDTVGHLLLIFTVGPILPRKLFRPPSNIFSFQQREVKQPSFFFPDSNIKSFIGIHLFLTSCYKKSLGVKCFLQYWGWSRRFWLISCQFSSLFHNIQLFCWNYADHWKHIGINKNTCTKSINRKYFAETLTEKDFCNTDLVDVQIFTILLCVSNFEMFWFIFSHFLPMVPLVSLYRIELRVNFRDRIVSKLLSEFIRIN